MFAKKNAIDDATPTLEIGADVYFNRCTICHGIEGKGKGVMPLKIKDYPSTHLLTGIKNKDSNAIKRAVIYGGSKGDMSTFMPPMGNDLTWTEIESVVLLLLLLKEDHSLAVSMIKSVSSNYPPSARRGEEIFSNLCILCHGKDADGKGRMAKILTTPPPANLITSLLTDANLKEIIRDGGSAVGRSSSMPPWKEQLTEKEIDSVILFIKSIQK